MKKIRLDQLLYDRGMTDSRERAKTSIMAGLVTVNGHRTDKPGMAVPEDAEVELRGDALPYVSRGGLKLEKALRVYPVSPRGLVCLDCGASTGGFTDVMLQNGAAKVYAVDVGYGQLAWKIRSDPRVVCLERTNIRFITEKEIPEPIGFATADLSFISLRLVLGAVYGRLSPLADMICLVKPQFEAGKDKVGKKGVVRDEAVHREVLEDFMDYSRSAGFGLMGLDYSPIRGPEGNIEYLAWIRKDAVSTDAPDLKTLVEESHAVAGREQNAKI